MCLWIHVPFREINDTWKDLYESLDDSMKDILKYILRLSQDLAQLWEGMNLRLKKV